MQKCAAFRGRYSRIQRRRTVNRDAIGKNWLFRSGLGAVLTVFCGLLLWRSPIGEAWVNTSYDYLFRFGTRTVTNKVVLILMDNEAYDHFHQTRGQPWSRVLHAQLLRKLAEDDSALVVLDTFLRQPRDSVEDESLAAALRQLRCVVLMAEQARVSHPTLAGARATLPTEPFLGAARGNWGVAWLDPDFDSIVRKHWPFPFPGPYPSLPAAAARLAGARTDNAPREQWLRYYGREGAWTEMSYRFALTQPPDAFRDKVVFVGTRPKTTVLDGEQDEFLTPYTHWTGESVGGVEILITAFLNWMNGDWLRRLSGWLEGLILLAAGTALGGGLCRLTRWQAAGGAAAVVLTVTLGAVSVSYFTNYWIPWLVIAGGQVPVALGWALVRPARRSEEVLADETPTVPMPLEAPAPLKAASTEELPECADYELVNPPFGRGSYGKVWLARNAIGEWQALKAIYRASFGDAGPYDREFNGIRRYKPLSDKHPALLRVDFVSKKRPDYFYYVMELGDALEPGWEGDPAKYRPHDLTSERNRVPGRRLPLRECVRIGLALSSALDFLHRNQLTHRDIKPQNIIFVKGQPKLADVGLISEIRPGGEEGTYVGTPGYLPPAPERPGTPQADVYALGVVLYVLSTGQNPAGFPEISMTLAEGADAAGFLLLNAVILKACQPDCQERYASAVQMHEALAEVQTALDQQGQASP